MFNKIVHVTLFVNYSSFQTILSLYAIPLTTGFAIENVLSKKGNEMDISLDDTQRGMILNVIFEKMAVIIFDPNRKVIFANQNMATILGYSQTEIIGIHHEQLCFQEYANSPAYQQFWVDLLINKKNFRDKIFRKTKRNQKLVLEGLYFPILNQAHQVDYVMKIAFDITKREEYLASTLTEVQNSSARLNTISYEGETKIQELTASLEHVVTLAYDNQHSTDKLITEIKMIETLLRSIDSIAQNLKLLSFNTALEVARHTNQLNGFNVIASEMKKLSENTRHFTKEITTELELIDTQIAVVSKSSGASATQIEQVTTHLNEIQTSYKSLLETSDLLAENAVNLANAT